MPVFSPDHTAPIRYFPSIEPSEILPQSEAIFSGLEPSAFIFQTIGTDAPFSKPVRYRNFWSALQNIVKTDPSDQGICRAPLPSAATTYGLSVFPVSEITKAR